jgi:NitT/TauT family transport system permease protein
MAQISSQAPLTARLNALQQFRKTASGQWTIRILFYIVLLVAWQILFSLSIWPDYDLPGPLEVLNSLITGFTQNLFLQSILASLARLAIGYAISLVTGVILGLLIGRIALLKETIGSLFLGLQALPSVCWLPLAVLWFGRNNQAIIFVVVMGALFSITLSIEAGVRNTSPVYLRAARNMGTHSLSLYTQVIFPAALPTILNGLKQGWSFAWRSLMAGELIFTTIGLGQLLQNGRASLDSAEVVAVMLVIIAIGVAIDALIFGPLERLTRTRWGLTG